MTEDTLPRGVRSLLLDFNGLLEGMLANGQTVYNPRTGITYVPERIKGRVERALRENKK